MTPPISQGLTPVGLPMLMAPTLWPLLLVLVAVEGPELPPVMPPPPVKLVKLPSISVFSFCQQVKDGAYNQQGDQLVRATGQLEPHIATAKKRRYE